MCILSGVFCFCDMMVSLRCFWSKSRPFFERLGIALTYRVSFMRLHVDRGLSWGRGCGGRSPHTHSAGFRRPSPTKTGIALGKWPDHSFLRHEAEDKKKRKNNIIAHFFHSSSRYLEKQHNLTFNFPTFLLKLSLHNSSFHGHREKCLLACTAIGHVLFEGKRS